MDIKKLILLVCFCGALIVLLYICKMLSPLFDDVWKILVAGVPVGFLLGFWCGIKWKDFDIKAAKRLAEEKEKLQNKEGFKSL